MREKKIDLCLDHSCSMVTLWLRYTSQSGSFSMQHQSEYLSRQLAGLHSPSLDTCQLTSGAELFT